MVILLILYSQLCYPVALYASRLNMKICRRCKLVQYNAQEKARDVRQELKTKVVSRTSVLITNEEKLKRRKRDNNYTCVCEGLDKRNSIERKEMDYGSSLDLVQHLEKHHQIFELFNNLSRCLATLQS